MVQVWLFMEFTSTCQSWCMMASLIWFSAASHSSAC